MLPALNREFLGRVYGVTVGLGSLLTVGLAWTCESEIVLSFVAGLVMELGLVMSQDYAVRKLLSPAGVEDSGKAFLLIGARYGLTILLLYGLTQNHLLHPLAFVGGLLLAHAVIVAQVAGALLRRRLGVSVPPHVPKGL
jgi:hypothetical protein